MKRSPGRKLILLTLLSLSLILLAGCTAQTPQATATPEPAATTAPTATPEATAAADVSKTAQKTFNAEELAQYNGENGNPAYIAVDGVVYDVTDVPQWKNGSHFGRFQAGADLTEEIKTVSPHGVSKLDGLPVVGVYEP